MKLLKEDLLVEARYVNKDNPSEVIETNDEGALTKVPDGTIIGKKYANVDGDTYFHKIDGDRLFVYKLNDEGQLEKETPKEFVEEGTYQREKEEVERKATEEKNNKERAANLLNNIIELEKKKGENAWFEVLVPHDGPAKSVAGEWIRAIEKIRYRYYNDGDYFYTGYGLETSGPAASYLSNIDDEINDALVTIAEEQLEDDEYEKETNFIFTMITDRIKKDPMLLVTRNEDDYLEWDGNDWADYSCNYEFECDFSGDLEDHLDKGHIDESDLYQFVEDNARSYCSSSPNMNINQQGSDWITIENLSKDDFTQIQKHWDRWITQWLEDLDAEYPYEDEEETDEDDE